MLATYRVEGALTGWWALEFEPLFEIIFGDFLNLAVKSFAVWMFY